jgi:lipoprotein-anchoring transpeptidase ErfK/SrfK
LKRSARTLAIEESIGREGSDVVYPVRSVSPAARLTIARSASRVLNARPALRLAPSRVGRLRIDIALASRKLSLIDGADTILSTPVAVASGLTLQYAGRAWTFKTPRGDRHVLRKAVNPVWTPPDWHYAEAAADHHLRLVRLPDRGVAISRGRRVVVRDGVVGVVMSDGQFRSLPADEHIVFDGKLFIPPYSTMNRRVTGELGPFALDLGGGYMIHGSVDSTAIGQARTHGCIRVGDDDLQWLFENVPIGTRVRIQ